jgi:hypothetical protein
MFGSKGGAALIQSLAKYKVFDTWKRQNVEFVHFVDLANLNVKYCDPMTFGFLSNMNLNCVAEVIKNVSKSKDPQDLASPVVLQREDEEDFVRFYPFEMERVQYRAKRNMSKYITPYVSIFTTVDHILKMYRHHHKELFAFRLREIRDGRGYTTSFSNPPKFPDIYRFVQDSFNIMKFDPNCSLIEKSPYEMILWKYPVTKHKEVGVKKVQNVKTVSNQIEQISSKYFEAFSDPRTKNLGKIFLTCQRDQFEFSDFDGCILQTFLRCRRIQQIFV